MLKQEVLYAVSAISSDVTDPGSPFWLARALAEATNEMFKALGFFVLLQETRACYTVYCHWSFSSILTLYFNRSILLVQAAYKRLEFQ